MDTPTGRRGVYDDRLDDILARCGVDGWDSYGAGAVTPEAIAAAKRLLDSTFVSPSVNGGVQVSWLSEAMWVEFDDEGNAIGFGGDLSDMRPAGGS